jgi:transposase
MESVMSLPANKPEVEVSSKPTRRRFTAEYKRKILKEAADCTERGAIGALLRREGLYSSHLIAWREAAERGELAGLTSKKRGPKAKVADARDRRIAELEKANSRLTKRLERADVMISIQKKVAQLLGIALPESPSDEES